MTIRLCTDELDVVLDEGRGADILALIDRRSGLDVLFRTPWRARADALRAGQRPFTADETAGWLEGYRGGWQTLCPVAGDPALVHGAPVPFHGEASIVPWSVDEHDTTTATLHLELFSVPLRIERVVSLVGARLSVTDTLVNLSAVELTVDYVHHPAFGGPFLDGDCVIETGARRFVNDPGHAGLFAAGRTVDWPLATTDDGTTVDLRTVPAPGERRELFGWLDDFDDHWASITNRDRGLTVRLAWDGASLPYAWLWEELNATADFPWDQRARTVAIEPASVQTGGPARQSAAVVPASGRYPVSLTLTLEHHNSGVPHD